MKIEICNIYIFNHRMHPARVHHNPLCHTERPALCCHSLLIRAQHPARRNHTLFTHAHSLPRCGSAILIHAQSPAVAPAPIRSHTHPCQAAPSPNCAIRNSLPRSAEFDGRGRTRREHTTSFTSFSSACERRCPLPRVFHIFQF